MLRKTLWIFSLVLLSGCASLTSPPKTESAPPLEQVFEESYETMWRAVQFALKKYPMKVADIEAGVFETQDVRGDLAWRSPQVGEAKTGGQRYRISIKILKGKNSEGKEATKVIILKRAEVQRDFFSDFEKLPSDGLEEKSIMYRIERELFIEKGLKKVKKEV